MAEETIIGEVRGFGERTENKRNKFTNEDFQEHIWTFQLERRKDGQRLPPVGVEMRGESFSGLIRDGHVVRLYQSTWREGEMVQTNRVYNETLQTPVQANSEPIPWFRILIAVLMVLAFLAFVIWGIARINSWTPPF